MFSPSTNPKSKETEILDSFMNHTQNTHHTVVSNSVGMTVLKLKDIYIGESPTEESIAAAYRKCLNEINAIDIKPNILDYTFDIQTFKPAIQHIINLSSQPSDVLDVVTLYLPTAQSHAEVIYRFTFNEVLLLVWQAINDDKKFAHNYLGSESDWMRLGIQISTQRSLTTAEKERLAEMDKPLRILNFLNTIERIRTDSTCRHGTRNELVFILNHAYDGVELIEDERATVLAILKENINKLFWHNYRKANAEEKKKLNAGIIEWISSDNAAAILQLVDPGNTIANGIDQLFIRHGNNPKNIKLAKIIDEALLALEFSCNPKEYPALALAKSIFYLQEIEDSPNSKVALGVIQEWIKTSCQLSLVAHQIKLSNFYAHYQAHKNLNRYDPMLKATNFLNEATHKLFSEFEKTNDDYFKAVTSNIKTVSPVAITTLETIQLVELKIKEFKKHTMADEIENFFARWYSSNHQEHQRLGTNSQQKQLYALLIDDDFQAKIIISDADIKKFMESATSQEKEQGFRDITPYLVNRVFLNAIMVLPTNWSETFKKFFNDVCDLVLNENSPTTGLANALQNHSYPEPLTKQLKYLLILSNQEAAIRPTFSVLTLLLPQTVQTTVEWCYVSSLMSDKKRKEVYQLNQVRLTKIFRDDLSMLRENMIENEHFCNQAVKEMLNSIPEDKRLHLLTIGSFAEVAKEIFKLNKTTWRIALESLPQQDRYAFIKFLSITFLRDKIQSPPALHSVLAAIPLHEKIYFLVEELGITKVKEIFANKLPYISGLALCIKELPGEEQVDFIREHLTISFVKETLIVEYCYNSLTTLLHALHPGVRLSFITDELGIDFIKHEVFIGQLVSILKALPEQARLWFINEFLTIPYFKSEPQIKEFLDRLINILPQNLRLSFMLDTLGIEFVRDAIKGTSQFGLIYSILDENERSTFIEKFKLSKLKESIAQRKNLGLIISKEMPGNLRYPFIQLLGSEFIEEYTDNGYQFNRILTALDSADREFFIAEHKEHLIRLFTKNEDEKDKSDRLVWDPQTKTYLYSGSLGFFLLCLAPAKRLSLLADFDLTLIGPQVCSALRVLKDDNQRVFLSKINFKILKKWIDGKLENFQNIMRELSDENKRYLFEHIPLLKKHLKNLLKQKDRNPALIIELITPPILSSEDFKKIFSNNKLLTQLFWNAPLKTLIKVVALLGDGHLKSMFDTGKKLSLALKHFKDPTATIEFFSSLNIDLAASFKISEMNQMSDESILTLISAVGIEVIKDQIKDTKSLACFIKALLKDSANPEIQDVIRVDLGLDFIFPLINQNKAEFYEVLNLDEREEFITLIDPYQKISSNQLAHLYKPERSMFFGSSSNETLIYDEAIKLSDDGERFSFLCKYINNESHQNERFCKLLIERWGKHFFIDVKPEASLSQTPGIPIR